MRKHRSVVVGALVVALLGVASPIAHAEKGEFISGSSEPLVPACSPNDSDATIPTSARDACIAGYEISTRGSITKSGCFDAEKQEMDHQYRGGKDGDCSNVNAPIELIAKSRFLYRLNNDVDLLAAIHPDATGTHSDSTISSDIQWEMSYVAKVTRKDANGDPQERIELQKVDLGVYDAGEVDGSPSDLALIEAKVQCQIDRQYRTRAECDEGTVEAIRDDASEQLRRYLETYPNAVDRFVRPGEIPQEYYDRYRLRSFCKDGGARYRTFEVEPAPQADFPGVLEIYTVEDSGCSTPEDPAQETGPGEEQIDNPLILDNPGIMDSPDFENPCPQMDPEEFAIALESFSQQLIEIVPRQEVGRVSLV